MRSGLEGYAADKLAALRAGIRNRDRAVVIGAALSFLPIFPACFFGALLSLFNLALIYSNRTSLREKRLVVISLVVGCLNSILWVYLFIFIGGAFGVFFESILEAILGPLGIFYDAPPNNLNQRDFSV